MRSDQQIRINELLLEREALFVRIHALERQASALLGEPYPFVRPPLPSDLRAKRKPGAGPAARTAGLPNPPAARDRLRRLEDRETLYRVTYCHFGRTLQEDHDDAEALRTLLASQGAQLKVLRIETVDDGGRTQDVLFTAATAE